MNLRKQFLTNNECYKVGRKQVVKKIMVHSTGANNPNLRRYVAPNDGLLGEPFNTHWNTFKPGDRQVCVHAFIGKLADGTIATYQTLPWDMVGWHSGAGAKGSANFMGYIGFEICEDNRQNKDYFLAVYRESVELCAYLCYEFDLDPTKDIIDHSEGHKKGIASNHGDVGHWFKPMGKSMDSFRADVMDQLRKMRQNNIDKETMKNIIECEDEDMAKVYNTINEVPEYARPIVAKLIKNKIVMGNGNSLGLTDTMIRMMVYNDRAGLYKHLPN